jgi:cyclopropane fatty-acyl-phospholipid synthase-like methyltransferase
MLAAVSAADELPAPEVAPDVYDEEYYRTACGGYESWAPSEGREVAAMYVYVFGRLGLEPGQRLVDVGTGRGELLAVAAEAGVEAIGIEYSEAALKLARQTIEVHGAGQHASALLADARALPIEDAGADAATLLDVVEHLSPQELDNALREVRRILKPGGVLLIHTLPNRTIYEVTYRLQRLLAPWRLRSWPADPRKELERLMHVNEQTVTTLRRALRKHFDDVNVWLGDWIYTDHVPSKRAIRTYRRLATLPGPIDRLGRGNLWAEARA